MSGSSSISASLETEVQRYRTIMASFLQLALSETNKPDNDIGLEDRFTIDKAEIQEDPMIIFRRTSHLLIAKARLHVMAALQANQTNNIHSLAVQMRPALECAGQIVSMVTNLLVRPRGAQKRLIQYLNADYFQMIVRSSKGQIDHNEIFARIGAANAMASEPPRKQRKFTELEKVRDLEFGGNWYRHLSDCFYHSDFPALKDMSFRGGVASCNTMYDCYAFASMLDYLAHQFIVMLMYDAVCAAARPGPTVTEDERIEKVMGLLQEKKEVADQCRARLISMAERTDR